jgi:hypothetical protein
MNALRSLGATRLAVGHVNRSDRDKPGANQTTFGSIFWRNMTRSMWQLQASGDQPANGEIAFALHHRKSNNEQRERWPLGFRYHFETGGGPITIEAHDVTAGDDLAVGATHQQRIREVLKRGQMTVSGIGSALGISPAIVRTTLNRMPDVVSFEGDGDAKTKGWGLKVINTAQPPPDPEPACYLCGRELHLYGEDGRPLCVDHAQEMAS